jgi:hypothetical protein
MITFFENFLCVCTYVNFSDCIRIYEQNCPENLKKETETIKEYLSYSSDFTLDNLTHLGYIVCYFERCNYKKPLLSLLHECFHNFSGSENIKHCHALYRMYLGIFDSENKLSFWEKIHFYYASRRFTDLFFALLIRIIKLLVCSLIAYIAIRLTPPRIRRIIRNLALLGGPR